MAERSGNQIFSLHGLVLIGIVVMGTYLSHNALRSSRPAFNRAPDISDRAKRVYCRLWQDPFTVLTDVYHDPDLSELYRDRYLYFQNEIQSKGSKNPEDGATVRILLVMTQGGNSVEDYESRLKNRYVIIQALGNCGYFPENTESVSFFTFSESIGSDKKPGVFPYEWFRFERSEGATETAGSDAGKYVLTVWLRSNYFDEQPLTKVRDIQNFLLRTCSIGEYFRSRPCYLLGPTSSTGLQQMLEEPVDEAVKNDPDLRIEVYSPWSTADPDRLMGNSGATADLSAGCRLEKPLKDKGIIFHRMIGTDGELIQSLIGELSLRGIFNYSNNRIILISESDTVYGRAFPVTFKRLLGNDPDQVKVYHYLSGIDGIVSVPQTDGSGDVIETRPTSPADGIFTPSPEYPLGRSQADYIRRLAANIDHESRHDKVQIRAIGIVATDMYDKILLLQALRETFQDVVFFTTDLDARMIHFENYQWTRNLIVASHYGFQLAPPYQLETPPFRDNYQTALFFACQEAVRKSSRYQAEPRVFEIGRNCAVDLNPNRQADSIHPEPRDNPVLFRSYIPNTFLIIVLAAFLLFTFCKRGACLLVCRAPMLRKRAGMDRPDGTQSEGQDSYEARCSFLERRYSLFLGVICLAAIAVSIGTVHVIYLNHYELSEGEPFSWFKGISLWPTVILRIAAAFLAVYFLAGAWYDLRMNENEIARDFIFSNAAQRPKSDLRGYFNYLRNILSYLNMSVWTVEESEAGKIDASALWDGYLDRGRYAERLMRSTLTCALYAMIMFLLINRQPQSPYRGPISQIFDQATLLSSGVLLIFMTFFVVDATRLCIRFIDMLKQPTQWPMELLKKNGFRRNRQDAGAAADSEYGQEYDEWLDIKLIAARTKAVGKLIYYPFIIAFILVVARSRFFDNWHWPVMYVVIFCINLGISVLCGLKMRHCAERARETTLKTLQHYLICADDKARSDRIRQMIEEIKSIKEGAFSPFSENPVIGAVLLPSGGVTLLALLETVGKI